MQALKLESSDKELYSFEKTGDFDLSFKKWMESSDKKADVVKALEKGVVPSLFKKPTNLKAEYGLLYEMTCVDEHLDRCFVDYDCPENETLNRYSDIRPYSDNRVKLAKNSIGTDYINASYVGSCFKGDHRAFIATQGPVESTIDDFWRMVLAEEVHLIIMLCKEFAGTRPQCCHYWPDLKATRTVDGTKITCVSEEINKKTAIVERKFEVKREDKTYEVRQYQWQGWPDHGVPDESDFPALDELVELVAECKKKDARPILLHCSAGVGRTGTLIAIVNLSLQIWHLKGLGKLDTTPISVFSTVRRLREYRFLMVQTLEQYDLVYKYTLKLLSKK